MALAASRACQVPSLCKGARSQARYSEEEEYVSDLHPDAPHHLPGFITAPGDTDTLMVGVGIFLIGAVLMVGIFYLHLHLSLIHI